MPEIPDDIMRQGRRRLKAWLPSVRAEAAKSMGNFTASSALGEAIMPHITEDKLLAVLIYPAPLGGWHADIHFRNMPYGVANTLGTPVGTPKKSKVEAFEAARFLLTMLVQQAMENAAAKERPKQVPAFLLYDCGFKLLPDFLDKIVQMKPEAAHGYYSHDFALVRIKEVLEELDIKEDFQPETFNGWPKDKQARLLSILHIAALSGVMRYPPMRDGTPSGHREPSMARH